MKLRLSVKQLRELQSKHGIANLLQPSAEDAAKLANLDFLVDFYYEGSRSLGEAAPSKEAVEEVDFSELLGAVQSFLKGDSSGKA